jgi:hypothetical protein
MFFFNTKVDSNSPKMNKPDTNVASITNVCENVEFDVERKSAVP